MRSAISVGVMVVLACNLGVAIAGNNASGRAWLSWSHGTPPFPPPCPRPFCSPDDPLSPACTEPCPPDNLPFIPDPPVFPLYLLLDNAPDIRELAVTLRWVPYDPAGCFDIMPVTADSACGWATAIPPVGGFDGDLTYTWSIRFPPTTLQKNCVVYEISAAACTTATRADFCLASVKTKDSLGRIDSLTILGNATINGGVGSGCPAVIPSAGYPPPVIFRATTSHPSTRLSIKAVGMGLGAMRYASIVAPDTSWRVALNIVEQSDTTLRAEGDVVALLPPCLFEVRGEDGGIATVPIPADQPTTTLDPLCFSLMQEDSARLHLQPKDFALIEAAGGFHIFYTRRAPGLIAATEKTIGHQFSSDLRTWNLVTREAITVRDTSWDNHHVWAPHIIQEGVTFYMFYTGVTLTADGRENQSIGIATSQNLISWTRRPAPILECADLFNADCSGSQQLRDPFIMRDPNLPSQWLMYYVTIAKDAAPNMVVGVARARSSDSLGIAWRDSVQLRNTLRSYSDARIIESPHVVANPDSSLWWLFFSPGPDSIPKYNPVAFQTNSVGPVDTVVTHWSTPPDTLYDYLNQDHRLLYWHAAEYLKVGNSEFLAAYDDTLEGVAITRLNRVPSRPDSFWLGCIPELDAPRPVAGMGETVGLSLKKGRSETGVGLRLELPWRMPVRLVVYDLLGRRRRTLIDYELPGGTTDVSWDVRDESGSPVHSGVYFVRLTCALAKRALMIPVLH